MSSPAPPPAPSFARRARRAVLRRVPYYLAFYVVMLLFFLFIENWLVFRTTTAAQAWMKPLDARTQDVNFTTAGGTRLHGWWQPPARPDAGAVVFCHGNGGNLSFCGDLAAELGRTTGAGVFLFDYPGYGHSDGSPDEASCYAAGDAAYAWVTTEAKIPPARVILMGQSLGSGVAVDLATRHEHRALVLMCPFTSLPAAAKFRFPFLPTHTLMRNRFDSLAKIDRCPRPLFVVHGTEDWTVPFRQGEELFAAAAGPKEFLRLDGFTHNNLACEQFYGPLSKFLERHP